MFADNLGVQHVIVALRRWRRRVGCCLMGTHCPMSIPLGRRNWFLFKPVLTVSRRTQGDLAVQVSKVGIVVVEGRVE
jgi:hypothetical protein